MKWLGDAVVRRLMREAFQRLNDELAHRPAPAACPFGLACGICQLKREQAARESERK